MDTVVNLFIGFVLIAITAIELKTSNLLFRPHVTRTSQPSWFWLEIAVGLAVGLVFVNSAFSQ